jgi:hypothetical protein
MSKYSSVSNARALVGTAPDRLVSRTWLSFHLRGFLIENFPRSWAAHRSTVGLDEGFTTIQVLITIKSFKFLMRLLTSVRFLFNMRFRFSPGAAAANRRNRRHKTSLLAIEGIPDGGGKPKKASNHAIIAGPPLGSQIVSSQKSSLQSAISNQQIQQRG